MSAYRFAVKVRATGSHDSWTLRCQGCGRFGSCVGVGMPHDAATAHAATCEDLHRANWAAACPSCRSYGRIAPACPVCLGRGYEAEREGLA